MCCVWGKISAKGEQVSYKVLTISIKVYTHRKLLEPLCSTIVSTYLIPRPPGQQGSWGSRSCPRLVLCESDLLLSISRPCVESDISGDIYPPTSPLRQTSAHEFHNPLVSVCWSFGQIWKNGHGHNDGGVREVIHSTAMQVTKPMLTRSQGHKQVSMETRTWSLLKPRSHVCQSLSNIHNQIKASSLLPLRTGSPHIILSAASQVTQKH